MSDERSTDYAVANLKLAIRYIGDNDRPAIRALDLATALDLVESQAVDLSRLREERDALRARTTRTTPVDWVVFDPEDACCETFGSEDEAVTYASERIAAYRDPDDGWNEDVAALLVAPVAYRARAVNVQHRDDHTEQDWSDMGYEPFDEVCDYELRPPVASSPDPKDGEQ